MTSDGTGANATPEERRAKLARLRAEGPAYPNQFRRTHSAEMLPALLAESTGKGATAPLVAVAGRLREVHFRDDESLCTLEDHTGRIRFRVSDEVSGVQGHRECRQWDIGDLVTVRGLMHADATGAPLVNGHEVQMVAKSLRPIPGASEWQADAERRHRSGYLALLVDRSARARLLLRSRLVAAFRRYFRRTSYLEVETPILQTPVEGRGEGTLHTHHNALDRALVLRSSASEYLRRLIVGGIDKVYEINRCFGGDDADRQVERTVLEIACAFANGGYALTLVDRVVRQACADALGSDSTLADGTTMDLSSPFPYLERPAPGATGFLVELDRGAPVRFVLYLRGHRVAEGGIEENDPERIGRQAGSDPDYVRAVEYGLPPCAGVRVQIDLLAQALTGASSVRDVILFPETGADRG